MEEWVPLENYPGYSASSEGRIRSDERDRILTAIKTKSGHTYVGLFLNGMGIKRGIAKLVSSAFIPNHRKHFTTPIHLNADLGDCRVENMLWRPRWFAMAYTQQFKTHYQESPPVRDRDSGEEFLDCWQLITKEGLLYTDLVGSILSRSYVFPTMRFYEWVE